MERKLEWEERDRKIKRNEIVVSFQIPRGGTIPIASRRRVLDARRETGGERFRLIILTAVAQPRGLIRASLVRKRATPVHHHLCSGSGSHE